MTADSTTTSVRAGHVLMAVKVIHTLVWLSIESCMAYLLYSGLTRQSDRRAAIAGAVVVGECVIFAANGLRCPLTDVAESLGAKGGAVTDIYLPTWLARNLPAIHVPLLILTVVLHRRNLHDHREWDRRPAPGLRSRTTRRSHL